MTSRPVVEALFKLQLAADRNAPRGVRRTFSDFLRRIIDSEGKVIGGFLEERVINE